MVRHTIPAEADPLGPQPQPLLEAVRRREPLPTAVKRVQAQQGAPGLDGLTVEERPASRWKAWPARREPRLTATDEPAPGRAGSLPKPGAGTRRRGIPSVLARGLAHAIRQGRGPSVAPDFAVRRAGVRPGRSAHHALERSWRASAAGARGVGHRALANVFARVQHDRVIRRVARKGKDKRRLTLLRRSRNAGSRHAGGVRPREAGTPQGSPRAPRWSTRL
jgi:RNA-directed DNA polymerase